MKPNHPPHRYRPGEPDLGVSLGVPARGSLQSCMLQFPALAWLRDERGGLPWSREDLSPWAEGILFRFASAEEMRGGHGLATRPDLQSLAWIPSTRRAGMPTAVEEDWFVESTRITVRKAQLQQILQLCEIFSPVGIRRNFIKSPIESFS